MERRRQADRLADLPDARRVAALADLGVDELEHLPLAVGERLAGAVGAGRGMRALGSGFGPCGLSRSCASANVTRSDVRGKHPFDVSLDAEQAFDQGECRTRMVRSPV